MTMYLMAAFLILSSIFLLGTTTENYLRNKKDNVERKYIEAKNYEKGLKDAISARNNFVKIYSRYPLSINELISVGFLSQTFTSSEYTKDISIDSIGNLSIANRDIDNNLKNLLLESNKETLKTLKNVSNTDALIEQKERFNNLKSNEESKTVGNNVILDKKSLDYKSPNLNSGSTNEQLKGW